MEWNGMEWNGMVGVWIKYKTITYTQHTKGKAQVYNEINNTNKSTIKTILYIGKTIEIN